MPDPEFQASEEEPTIWILASAVGVSSLEKFLLPELKGRIKFVTTSDHRFHQRCLVSVRHGYDEAPTVSDFAEACDASETLTRLTFTDPALR